MTSACGLIGMFSFAFAFQHYVVLLLSVEFLKSRSFVGPESVLLKAALFSIKYGKPVSVSESSDQRGHR